jgi:Tfp pilus assembly protein PilF
MMFLDKAIATGYKTAEAYSFLGAAYARMNEPEKAKETLVKALKINPDRQDAKELLNAIQKDVGK